MKWRQIYFTSELPIFLLNWLLFQLFSKWFWHRGIVGWLYLFKAFFFFPFLLDGNSQQARLHYYFFFPFEILLMFWTSSASLPPNKLISNPWTDFFWAPNPSIALMVKASGWVLDSNKVRLICAQWTWTKWYVVICIFYFEEKSIKVVVLIIMQSWMV